LLNTRVKKFLPACMLRSILLMKRGGCRARGQLIWRLWGQDPRACSLLRFCKKLLVLQPELSNISVTKTPFGELLSVRHGSISLRVLRDRFPKADGLLTMSGRNCTT